MAIILSESTGLAASRLRMKPVPTGSIAGGENAAITITWTTAFPDTNYTVVVSIIEATASTLSLRVHHIESKTATGIVVRVINDDTLNAKSGTLQAIAIHD